MTTSPDTPTLTADQLQAIRDTDAASGENLQFCPAAWQHRRQLLAYIDAMEKSAAERTAEITNANAYVQTLGEHVAEVLGFVEPYNDAQEAVVSATKKMLGIPS